MPITLTFPRRALAAGLLLATVACGGGGGDDDTENAASDREATSPTEQDATATTAAQDDGSAAGEVDDPQGARIEGHASAAGLSVEDARLVRLDDRQMALQFQLVNETGDQFALLGEIDAESMLLVDAPRGIVYGVLEDGTRTNDLVTMVDDGASVLMTAVYSAPPPEVNELLVLIDGMVPARLPVEAQDAALVNDPALDGEGPEQPFVAPVVLPVATGDPGDPSTFEVALPGDVLFEFGSDQLTAEAVTTIEELAVGLPVSSGAIVVEGHTDAIGDDASNQALSERRAVAVAAALEAAVVGDFTFETVGFGETQPVATETNADGSDDPAGRARNRRVTVRVASTTAAPAALPARDDLTTQYADLGATIGDVSVQRLGGAALLQLTVTASGALELLPGDGFIGINDAPDDITLADVAGARRHGIGRWNTISGREFTAGTFSPIYGPASGSRVIPAGESVTFWAMFAEPPAGVTAVDVEVPGFGLLDSITVEG